MLQVIVLSEGHQLFFGLPEEAVTWFSGSLGYTYAPAQDGAVSDWLMDLVSVGFSKRSDFGSRHAPPHPFVDVGASNITCVVQAIQHVQRLRIVAPGFWYMFACLRWGRLPAGQ